MFINFLSLFVLQIALGGKDRSILVQDIRCPDGGSSSGVVRQLVSHKQEICGLKWSFDDRQLASGGNDNKLFVWSMHGDPSNPMLKFHDHQAAVKAVAWYNTNDLVNIFRTYLMI